MEIKEEQQTPQAPALNEFQVRLKDGRVVTLREPLGADEMIVAAQLGKVFTSDGAGAVVFQASLIARCVESIDGKPVEPMRSYEAYRDLIATFKGRDWNKIRERYNVLNGEGEEVGNE